jgi:hypothetical protein
VQELHTAQYLSGKRAAAKQLQTSNPATKCRQYDQLADNLLGRVMRLELKQQFQENKNAWMDDFVCIDNDFGRNCECRVRFRVSRLDVWTPIFPGFGDTPRPRAVMVREPGLR